MKKGAMLLFGFTLFILGMTSLFLGMSGVILSFLKFIELLGPKLSLLVKFLMVFGGIVIAYMGYIGNDKSANEE